MMAPRRRRAAGLASAALLAAALVLGSALSASAHDQLVSMDPAVGSTVTQSVSVVTLTFNDDVLDLGDSGSASLVQVTSAGKHFETACATTDHKTVTVPVALGEAGTYTVSYSVVSADGHRVSANETFTYAPDGTTTAAAGATASPCADVAKGGDAASDSDTITIILAIAGGIVVLAVVGVVLAVVLTRRKPEGDA